MYFVKYPKRATLTQSQSKNLVQISADVGYQVIPDHRITGVSYKWDDNIALLPVSEGKERISKDFHIIQ